ncbi:MAG TPA: FAD-dependent oxidoreductase [Polyangiaceae bacterium]|nr:FAD-dependent oxidoreductase [Polyangiaceae bacterium]
MTRVPAELVSVRGLSNHAACLRLRVTSNRFVWRPGQHVEVSTTDEPDHAVPYSIASRPLPDHPGEFELAISNRGTDWLDRLNGKTGLLVSEPQGQFIWRPEPEATLLVGIGTAVAPLRAMLHAALALRADVPITLLLGARTETDILFREELWGLSRKHPRFQFEPSLTHPSAHWSGLRGRIQQHLLRILHDFTPNVAYVCGSSEMVRDVLSRLEASSVLTPSQIRYEMG